VELDTTTIGAMHGPLPLGPESSAIATLQMANLPSDPTTAVLSLMGNIETLVVH
jgi:hypothetical protein